MAHERDDGAAVVEFVMISVLLVILLFGVLQVGVYFYARNIVAASAADGARYAASAGMPSAEGGTRAEQLIADSLGEPGDFHCTGRSGVAPDSDLPVTTVHCHGTVPAFLAPGHIPIDVDTTASALEEGR